MSALAQEWPAFHTTEKDRREWYGTPDAPQRTRLLDNPSDPHPILSALMDEALLRILLTADGRSQALTERVTGSREASAPTSDLATVLDNLAGRFTGCKTHRARLLVIKEAQDTADRLRFAPDRSKVRGTPEWRQAIARDSRSMRVVAAVYGVNASTVCRIKKQAKS